MIDYFSHLAALQRATAGLASTTDLNPAVMAARDQQLLELKNEPQYATLGVFIDHLMAHAVSDGSELALLEDAAALWTQGMSLYTRFGAARARMEGSLTDYTGPDALTNFNAALAELNQLRDQSAAMQPQFASIRTRALKRKFLKEHPRQRDANIASWDWGNLFLARRTDAFVRGVFGRAQTPEERAFAFGTLASYGGNVAGSAFLGHVVGGPRRAHRFRDRLARNAVGAWVAKNLSLPRLSDVSASIDFGGVLSLSSLPTHLKDLIQGALKDAYQRSDFPDLDLGYARTLRHLQLLDSFPRPDLPVAPPVMMTLSGDMVGQPPDMDSMNGALDDPGDGGIGGGGGVGTGDTVTGADSQKKSGDLCLLIFAALITFGLVILINCIVQWSTKDGPCQPLDFDPDDPPEAEDALGTDQAGLTKLAEGPGGADIVQTMYGLHQIMWQAFDAAYSFLAVSGLIYPDAFLMGSPLYKQFLSIPASTGGYPRRPSTNDYIEYPNSAVEHPDAVPSALPPGTNPFGFLFGLATHAVDAWTMARPLWSQIAHHVSDSTNFDLDADRGFMHPCWRTKAGTSINDEPIQGENLAYPEI